MAYNDFSLADLAAVIRGNGNENGLGGDNGILWLLLFIMLGGSFGNNRGYGNGAGGIGGNELYPWLNQQQTVNDGFRDQMLQSSITGVHQAVTSGFGDVQNALCSGFAGVSNGFAQAEISANARQMAGMQQQYAAQTAMMQGFNGLGSQLSDCCCENRLATANQTATILAEHCSDRAALSDGIRDIIAANNAGTQRIIDKMCDQELQAERRENDNLRQQINMMNLAASQTAQTAQLLADNFAQTNALEQYLAPVPRPAYIVQNPNCCQQGFGYGGCGCGCAMAA